MKTGVYQIKNLVNGKVYVGSAVNINHRWVEHKSDLSRQKHHNEHLQYAWNKYGESNFNFEILEECPVEKLIYWEQIWMDSLCACDKRLGYNISPIAGSQLGTRQSEESRRKNSLAHRGEAGTNAKLTWKKVREIREKYLAGKHTYKDLSKEYGVNKGNIRKIIHNETWNDETLPEEYFEKIALVVEGSQKGEKSVAHKLTLFQVREIREKYCTGKYKHKDLSKEYGINQSNIEKIINNKNWKDESLSEEYFEAVARASKKNSLNKKLTKVQVGEIREKYLTGKYLQKTLAKEYEITPCTVSDILNNKIWKEK
jgi:group I intron endonuclease